MKKSFLISLLTHFSVQIVTFASVVGLARLLSPAEIGVYAVVSSIIFLAIELRSFGVGQYLIREKTITEEQIRTCLGILIILSWSIGISLIISSSYLALFYNQPDLSDLIIIVSITFFISPFAAITQAILTRKFQFGKLFVMRIITTLTRASSVLLLAYLGFSYYSIAIAALFSSVINLFILRLYKTQDIPWIPSFNSFKPQLKFGVYATIANLSNRFTLHIPDLIIGKVATMADVGLFSRGFGFISFSSTLLADGIKPVVLPYMAEVDRQNKNIADAYLKLVEIYTGFSIPVFAAIHLSAYPIIVSIFGQKWALAAPIASVLALWGLLQSIHMFIAPILITLKREKNLMRVEVGLLTVRLAILLIAAQYGLMVIAWGLVISGLFDFIIKAFVLRTHLGHSFTRLLKALYKSSIVGGILWLSLYILALNFNFHQEGVWMTMLIIGSMSALIWVSSIFLINHSIKLILLDLLKTILKK